MLKKYPYYLKCTVVLFGLVLLIYSIFTIKAILVPLSFGLMLSIILNPLVIRLQKLKFPKILTISIALLIGIILLVAIGYFLSTQIASFSDQLPILKKKVLELIQNIQQLLSHQFNLKMHKQDELINEAETSIEPMVGQTLATLLGSLE